jgi:uncharacterized lipoprotein YbaY/heat shock protein HslJ
MKLYARACIVSFAVLTTAALLAQGNRITGTVMMRERIALSPRATVEIRLEDVSRADASGEVVARMRLESPGQPPIGFELPYDANRIDPRRRYAVRAEIADGDRVMFTTAQPAFVLTQGRGSQVNLMLVAAVGRQGAVAGSPAPSVLTSTPPLAAAPSAIELRNLPATFAGTLRADDGSLARYEINLFPDESFFLRRSPLPARGGAEDDLGSYVLSSDRRVLILRGSKPTSSLMLAIRDNTTLRPLTLDGRPTAEGELRRASGFNPLTLRATMTGVYEIDGNGGYFIECLTGQRWPVNQGDAIRAANAPTRRTFGRDSTGVFLAIEGRLSSSRGPGRAPDGIALDVERVTSTQPRGRCEPRFSAAPLANTPWMVTMLRGEGVKAGRTGRPSLTFREQPRSFAANSGCSHLAGTYQVVGETIGLRSAGTLGSCPDGGDLDRRFRAMLTEARGYRILGRTMELLNANREVVARFEAGGTGS